MLNHAQLCQLIPHSGNMCLLDRLVSWDDESVVCLSHTHRKKDNPLRYKERLSSVHVAEYGAQAMAIHGGLLARQTGDRIPPGFLVGLRDIQLNTHRLDLINSPLTISATQLLADGGNLLYSFDIYGEDKLITKGKLTVMVQPEAAP